MNKDKKWLLREFRNLTYEFDYGYLKIKAIDVIPLIEQLDEPKKMVIPRLMADHIELCKSKNKRLNVALSESPEDEMAFEMGVNLEEANEIYARAWLDGYEVEKEKLYVVELSNSNEKFVNYKFDNYENVFLNKRDGIVFIDSCRLFINDIKKYNHFGLTEKEIKDYDERFWPFAMEVSE